MTLKLFNTLTRQTEDFKPLNSKGSVLLYTCGPTVYNYLHVGNWAAYVYWDTLVRVLMANGYTPNRVMNITDVGHLTSDEDEGEDKLEKGAKREGKTAWEIAEFYAEDFLRGMDALGMILPEHIVRATDCIPQQLALIRTLKEKGHTYEIDDGIYFDTSTFPSYADFARLDLTALKAGARVDYNTQKRNPSDFALWKFSPAGEKRDMEWETPAELLDETDQAATPRMGFPGWHLECSAIAMDILGPQLDIHTGGIDHIPVHHTNEIAQSESATGQQFSQLWLHCNHLKVNGTKISKSLGNGYTLQDLIEKGFTAMDYRMFVLQGQFQNEGNFSFENLEAAQSRLTHWREIAALRHQIHDSLSSQASEQPSPVVNAAIKEPLDNNLNTPVSLQRIDEVFSGLEKLPINQLSHHHFVELLTTIDDLLGLQLQISTPDVSEEVKRTLLERSRARDEKDWERSDGLRDALIVEGIGVRDHNDSSSWYYL